MDEPQRYALQSMIAYVAHEQRVSQDLVEDALCSSFRNGEIGDIPSDRYQEAIEFLLDLQVGLLVN